MTEQQIILSRGNVEYKLHRSNRKTLQMQVIPDIGDGFPDKAILQVKAPERMPLAEIEKFLRQKEGWIQKHLDIVNAGIIQNPSKQYQDGDEVLYRGKSCLLKVEEAGYGNRCIIYFKDAALYLQVPIGASADQRKEAVEFWYRKQAKLLLPSKAEYYASVLKVRYNGIRIKDQRSRWGSCSAKGNLNFNFRLIMAPDEIADYVVVHELCHLIHMNHSKDFWNCVESVLPDYKKRRQWLKINAALLA